MNDIEKEIEKLKSQIEEIKISIMEADSVKTEQKPAESKDEELNHF